MKNFKHLAKATLLRNMAQLIKRSALAESATTNALHDPSARVSGGLMLGKQVQAIVQKKDRCGRTIAPLMLKTNDVI